MAEKAFIFYAAVTPAGARLTLYRETLDAEPSPVLIKSDYDTTVSAFKEYFSGVISSCTFLPVNTETYDLTPAEDVIDVLFEQATEGSKTSIKGTIYDMLFEERRTTVLKLVYKLNGVKQTLLIDLNPAGD